MAAVAEAFVDWGWPTVESLRAARAAIDAAGTETVLIGSGGLRHGVDALKVLCLGADLASFARALLAPAVAGPDTVVEAVGVLVEQLQVGAWAAEAEAVTDLTPRLLVAPASG
jgi:isopentenyl-diphosphate delta-isomerase